MSVNVGSRLEPEPSEQGLLSLFCGAGGLDLGFEKAGFPILGAFDVRKDAVLSYNHNRKVGQRVAKVEDVAGLTLGRLDEIMGRKIAPVGLIGGPPCQSFSQATHSSDDDPRHNLPLKYAMLLKKLNKRNPVEFFVFENVPGLLKAKHAKRFETIKSKLADAGFNVHQYVMNASDFGVPQNRPRLILVGTNRLLFPHLEWIAPVGNPSVRVTVRKAIHHLPEPAYWTRELNRESIDVHPNHWCMQPRSPSFFTKGALVPGTARGRSFRTLEWDTVSPTVAYGHREVHIHPGCHRRLSVYEALILQGFPHNFELLGSLSSQITQISEAVPPPLALAIASSIKHLLRSYRNDVGQVGKSLRYA